MKGHASINIRIENPRTQAWALFYVPDLLNCKPERNVVKCRE
jgi:hypothetical protein